MLKTAEYVSLGHPDKTADYISSYILDRLIEQDPSVRYAVEVMFKDNTVVLGGEVCGNVNLKNVEQYVKKALCEIGYDEKYARIWGDSSVDIRKLKIINLVGCQSNDIYQGVADGGWGDQGVFSGYACQGEGFLPKELFLARKLCRTLYAMALSSPNLGLDIKTQITVDDNGDIVTAIAAIPMIKEEDLSQLVCEILDQQPQNLIINGTGRYVCHSSVADCGITGRKLACDFYSTSCPVGGGSPWGKDASKADVALNILARRLAVKYLQDNDEVFVYLSSCIGKSELPSAVIKKIKQNQIIYQTIDGNFSPEKVIEQLGLNKPVYTRLCRDGIV